MAIRVSCRAKRVKQGRKLFNWLDTAQCSSGDNKQAEPTYYLGQDSAECVSSGFKFCLAATIMNCIIILYHAVKLSQLLYPYENSNMVISDKNCYVSCKSWRVCLFDDEHFDEKERIKPHLQPLHLQSELIILSFSFNRMLSNKICFEFWAWQQRL